MNELHFCLALGWDALVALAAWVLALASRGAAQGVVAIRPRSDASFGYNEMPKKRREKHPEIKEKNKGEKLCIKKNIKKNLCRVNVECFFSLSETEFGSSVLKQMCRWRSLARATGATGVTGATGATSTRLVPLEVEAIDEALPGKKKTQNEKIKIIKMIKMIYVKKIQNEFITWTKRETGCERSMASPFWILS